MMGYGYDFGVGMGFGGMGLWGMGLWWIIMVALVVLSIAALVKYLRN